MGNLYDALCDWPGEIPVDVFFSLLDKEFNENLPVYNEPEESEEQE